MAGPGVQRDLEAHQARRQRGAREATRARERGVGRGGERRAPGEQIHLQPAPAAGLGERHRTAHGAAVLDPGQPDRRGRAPSQRRARGGACAARFRRARRGGGARGGGARRPALRGARGGAVCVDGDRAGHFRTVDRAVEGVGAGRRKRAAAAPFRARGSGRSADRNAASARGRRWPVDPTHPVRHVAFVLQRHRAAGCDGGGRGRPGVAFLVVAAAGVVDGADRIARFRARHRRQHHDGGPEESPQEE